jgi:16S rRNA (guanine1207-N2)-methyltransferase
VAAKMARKSAETNHYFSEDPKVPARFGLVRTCLLGRPFEFTTGSGVFSVKQIDLGTRVLIENMILPDSGCVLDVGCGYGALGIAAAKSNIRLHLVLTDVNRRAVLLARQNAEKNHVNNVEVRQGNLFDPVHELYFDCVLSNPPVSAGMKTVEAIIQGSPAILKSGGTLQMVVRSKIGKKTLPEAFKAAFGQVEISAIQSGYRVLMAKKN